jgi:hypothetical protein
MKRFAGLFLLLIIAVGGAALYMKRDAIMDGSITSGLPHITATGYVGGEKMHFIQNPKVISLLKDRYNITLEGKKAGSIAMVQNMPLQGIDFLWPSNQIASSIYKKRNAPRAGEDLIFNSPIVIYTWTPIAQALQSKGIVEERDGSYFVVDSRKLISLINANKKWSELGLGQLYGSIKVVSTDPAHSNSGNMFAGLVANLINDGDVVTMDTLPNVLPTVVTFFERMGFKERSSSDIFEQFIKTGMGAKPMVVGYENQMVEFSLANQNYIDVLKDKIRTLYPVPTLWSSHPLIALNDKGKRLIEALKDPEIQNIAWEEHGFRSGLLGVQNDPSILKVTGIPATVDAIIPMPEPEVMEAIIQAIH